MRKRLNLPLFSVGLIFLSLYLGVTIILSILEGTFFSKQILGYIENSGFISSITQLVLNHFPNKNIDYPLLSDYPHLIMSGILIPPFSILGIYYLDKIPKSFNIIKNNNVLKIDDESYKSLIHQIENKYNSLIFKIISFLIAIGVFLTFILMVYNKSFSFWWGSIVNGISGIYLSIIVSIIVYYMTFLGFIILITIWAFYKTMQYPVILRPFHPDKCNGFKTFGDLILIIYIFTFGVALLIADVYYFKYFGLEKSIIVNVGILIYFLCIPILLIAPALTISRNVRQEKLKYLYQLEDKLQDRFDKIQAKIQRNELDEDYSIILQDIEKLRETSAISEKISVWPFRINEMRSIILTYMGQIVIVIYEIFIR